MVASGDAVPPFIRNRADQRIYQLSVKREVIGPLSLMEPLLRGIFEQDGAATRALLCQSRGEEPPEPCSNCTEPSGVFHQCIMLRNKYKNRCTNCILLKRWDCTLAMRYLTEPDEDYEPPQHHPRQYRQQQHQHRQRQNQQRQRPQRQHLQISSLGTEVNPIDLTGEDD